MYIFCSQNLIDYFVLTDSRFIHYGGDGVQFAVYIIFYPKKFAVYNILFLSMLVDLHMITAELFLACLVWYATEVLFYVFRFTVFIKYMFGWRFGFYFGKLFLDCVIQTMQL